VRSRLRATMHSLADAPASRADRLHHELRRALLSGELPLTQRITEEQLAERFQTSRTPVRDALRRLETEGHFTRDGKGALRPSMPRTSTMREMYEVRLVLEGFAVRRAADREPGVDVNGLADLCDEWAELQAAWAALAHEFEMPDFVFVDEGFHESLARLSGNRTAARHLRDINERIRLLRIHDFTTPDRIEATIAEHLAVIEAVTAGDTERAAELMHDHVQGSAAVVEQRVGEVLARMLDSDGVLPVTSRSCPPCRPPVTPLTGARSR